ncbi:MAG: hypothetical protein KGZ58_13535 [Ignavibacteriales bacterium]|nr:hypothetical protein [Ignavibacteriales bacterium]
MQTLKTPFTNAQLELLKLFSRNISEEDLLEIKKQLAQYFAKKTIEEADKVWEEKGWTNKDAQRMLKKHLRKPTKRINA